jgi:hypothetical protein
MAEVSEVSSAMSTWTAMGYERRDPELGRLRCDGKHLYCGSGGCRQDIWLATPEGRWRLLLRDRIDEVHVPVPGAVVLRLDPE